MENNPGQDFIDAMMKDGGMLEYVQRTQDPKSMNRCCADGVDCADTITNGSTKDGNAY